MALPARSEIVVIGGGVVGCAIAYHLATRGREVTLVERKRLTDGSTWHAAGLIGQLRSSSNLTQLMRNSVQQYGSLEQHTGQATGWRPVGSIRVAASKDRWEELRRITTMGKGFGFDVHLLSPTEALELFPLLNTDGLYGATYVPSDGYADPSQLTHSFAAGARQAGATLVQDCRVESIERRGRRVVAVATEQGSVECDTLVNATGMWGTETAALAGVDVAVGYVEHQYVVTEKSADLPRDMPTFRDPDGRFYLKPEAGALLVGGWEDGSRAPWKAIPRDFGPELFAPDHDRFGPLAEAASRRVPYFGEAGIQTIVNGPIPFSPDAEPVMGVTEDLDNMFHCCGFSAGIAAAGGAAWAVANWIIDGDPGMDLWPFDVRRFGAPHTVAAYLEARSIEAYSHYYQVSYPNRELASPRGQRRSPLYDVLAAKGAVYGTKFGWERPNWFDPGATDGAATVEELTFGRSNAWDQIGVEHAAVRERVALADFTSFSKFEVAGPGALPLLQALAGANMEVPVGKIVYTQLLSRGGGIEADVTITRLADDRFYFVTGSAFGRHDVTYLKLNAPDDGSVTITDVTSGIAVLNLCGPRARELARQISDDDFANESFPYMTARHVDIGSAPVLALRATYVGELGYELHVPTEYARHVYECVMEAGEPLGIADVGYRCVNSLRLEKQYLAWAVDAKTDNNPFEAGLSFAVDADKPELLAGPALRRIRDEGVTQRLCWFTAGADVVMHGGELLTHASEPLATSVKSAGWGYTVGANIFSAYVPVALAGETEYIVEVAGVRVPARRHGAPLYDPKGARVRA
ncbi:MAG: GcvT family protein [Acidimicrobiales bacterium]